MNERNGRYLGIGKLKIVAKIHVISMLDTSSVNINQIHSNSDIIYQQSPKKKVYKERL